MHILGDTITKDFTTHDPLTGNVSDADSLPTVEVFENDNDTSMYSPIVEKRSEKTGNYRCSISISTGNGFEVGKSYNVVATATVNGVTAKSRIDSFVPDSKRVSDLNDINAPAVRDQVDLEFTERGYSADRASYLDTINDINDNTITLLYFNGVWIDVVDGESGTDFPIGTQKNPVNNLVDALSIITKYKVSRIFHIENNFTFSATDNIEEYEIIGESEIDTEIIIEEGCSCYNAYFEECYLTGVLNSAYIEAHSCILEDVSGVCGEITGCILKGEIILGGTEDTSILSCFDGVNPGAAVLNLGGGGRKCEIRDYFGGLEIKNKTGQEELTINFSAGRLKIGSTVTGGTIVVRGVGEISQNLGTATVNDSGLVNAAKIAGVVWDEILTGATHNISTSAGRRLRQLESFISRESFCQGGSANTIILDAEASSKDNYYRPGLVIHQPPEGDFQFARISSYDGTTKVATIASIFETIPISGDQFWIRPWASVKVTEVDPLAFDDIADAVWNAIATEYNEFGTIGYVLNYLSQCVKNKKYLIKEGAVWHLVIKDDAGVSDILKKALKDKDGNNITDIQAGVLAQELTSSV